MILFAIAILLASVLFFKGLKLFNYIDHVAGIMEMIPGPTPYPFVGNLFQFGLKPDEYPKKILQYCRKYEFQGFRSLVFFQYHVMISDPAEVQNILSSSALLYKEHLYSFLRPWLGDGLLTSSGARWLKHQKIYLPAFDSAAIDGYLQVVQRTSEKFIQKLQSHAEGEKIFDVQKPVSKCTLDVICEIATGIQGHSLDDESCVLHAAIRDLCDIIQERTFSIVKRFDTLFQFTPHYWKQRRALQALKDSVQRIVEQRKCELHNNSATKAVPNEGRPFLDVLLQAKLDGRALKLNEIFEELSTFIFSGHDPTASAIAFTLYTLSRHPLIQQKVYDEQKIVFAKYLPNELATVSEIISEHLKQMHYLDMVIRETLRLYPSVPLIARTNRKAIDINGTQIAKRSTVIMCLIAMGYNEKYFDEPCVFRPERFEQHVSDNGESFKSVPFSAGPRRCIAEKFAMYELKAIISKMVRNFEILPAIDGLLAGINDHSREDCVPESEFDPILNIRVTLKSENGIQLRLRKRK